MRNRPLHAITIIAVIFDGHSTTERAIVRLLIRLHVYLFIINFSLFSLEIHSTICFDFLHIDLLLYFNGATTSIICSSDGWRQKRQAIQFHCNKQPCKCTISTGKQSEGEEKQQRGDGVSLSLPGPADNPI